MGYYPGACWAFVVTESIEANILMNTGKRIQLSVQELIDCDKENKGHFPSSIVNELFHVILF